MQGGRQGDRKATDAAFFEGVNRLQRDCPFLKAPRKARKLPSEAFIVSHFAGDVCYVADAASGGGSWLEKNNDTLPAELQAELDGSSTPLMRRVFGTDDDGEGGGGGAGGGGEGGAG